MEIDAVPSAALAPRFPLPAELVSLVFEKLPIPHLGQGGKKDLLACGSVCRYWREIALPHIFRDIAFTFRSVPEQADPSAESNFAIDRFPRDEQEQYWRDRLWAGLYCRQSLVCFLRFLAGAPTIRELVKRLYLEAQPGYKSLQFGVHGGSYDYAHIPLDHAVEGAMMELNHETNITVFFGVLACLSNLEELYLKNVRVTPSSELPHPSMLPDPPALKVLRLHWTKMYPDTRIFDILQLLHEVGYLHISRPTRDYRAPKTIPWNCVFELEVSTVSVGAHSLLPADVFTLLYNSPSIDTLRALDVGDIPLEPTSWTALQGFLNVVGPNLEEFTCEIPYEHDHDTGARFRALDLTRCTNLRALTFRWFVQPIAYLQTDAPWTQTPEFFNFGIASSCPLLKKLTVQLVIRLASPTQTDQWFENLADPLARCENAIMRLMREAGIAHIDMGPPSTSEYTLLNDERREVLRRMFPRMHEQKLVRVFTGTEEEWGMISGLVKSEPPMKMRDEIQSILTDS